MGSINKVILIGNLGADPEIRMTPQGKMVASLSLATNETRKDQNGNSTKETEWHRVSFFGKNAEVLQQYAKKGTALYIEGKIRTRSWQDQQTQTTKYATEINGFILQLLSGTAQTQPQTQQPGPAYPPGPHASPAPPPPTAQAKEEYVRTQELYGDVPVPDGPPPQTDNDDDLPF